jgi:Flp pilus assembly protein TadG
MRNRRGGTLIEFSLVTLLVVTVMIAVLEVGRLMLSYVTVAEAVRAGVRYAIVNGSDVSGTLLAKQTAVQTVVQNVGSAAGVALSAPTVLYTACSPNCSSSTDVGSTVAVTATYMFTPVGLVSGLGVTISSTTKGTICY